MVYPIEFRILATVACLAMVPAIGHATDVTVFALDGRVLQGELLVVRDTALLIGQGGGYKMWEQQHHPNVVLVSFDSIQRVEIEGSSYLWYGALGGLALGLAVGAATAPSSGVLGDYTKGGRIIFAGLGGLLVGSVVGGSISSPGTSVKANSPGGFGGLRSLAKYDRDEPAYLKEIH